MQLLSLYNVIYMYVLGMTIGIGEAIAVLFLKEGNSSCSLHPLVAYSSLYRV